MRNRMVNIEHDVQDIRVQLGDVQTVILGPPPNRNNGLNGTLKTLAEEMNKAIAWGHEVWNVKRRDECLGLAEIKKVEARLARMEKGDAQMSIAKVNLKGVYAMGVLQFIGTIVLALVAGGALK